MRFRRMDEVRWRIAISKNAILVTRNRQDFEKVPGSDWVRWMKCDRYLIIY